MCRVILVALMAVSAFAVSQAEVINVEFKFTPFTGDPAHEDVVTTVPGTARVYLNNVLYAEQEVDEREIPVMFEEREVAPSVWLPVESCGPALRKGKNAVRIEFEPADPESGYRAQLRWASVMSESTEEKEAGRYSATNQSGEGTEEKEATGTVVFEREFQADFAADLAWHHYPAVTALDEADRKALAGLVAARVEAFQPDFSDFYRLLEGNDQVALDEMKESKCLERAYAAGARVACPPEDKLEILITGNPEVIIRARDGDLYFPADISALERISDEEVQRCLWMAFSVVYPSRLVVVRSPHGAWEVAY